MTKVGFTCSAFDLLHAGHILMLKECKGFCDQLHVGLQTDPATDRADKRKPIQSILERHIQLEAVSYVDFIHLYDTEEDLIRLLGIVGPDIRFVGEDWKNENFTGWDLPIQIHYNKRYGYSTTAMRKKIYTEEAKFHEKF